MMRQSSNQRANVVARSTVVQPPIIRDSQGSADDPLLIGYNANDLRDRENADVQTQAMQRAEIMALERKAMADSLRDNFQLTGSDLPADADPRQLHLF